MKTNKHDRVIVNRAGEPGSWDFLKKPELYFQMLVKPELEPSKFLAAPAPIQLQKRCSCSTVILLIFQMHFNFMFTDLSVYLKTIDISKLFLDIPLPYSYIIGKIHG